MVFEINSYFSKFKNELVYSFVNLFFLPDPSCFCSFLTQPIVNMNGVPWGCPSAVWSSGAPSSSYCSGASNRFPWWKTCCTWKWNNDLGQSSCQPKSGSGK